MDKTQVVNALIAEMREKLNTRTPENARDTDASILLFSKVIVALKGEAAIPLIEDAA